MRCNSADYPVGHWSQHLSHMFWICLCALSLPLSACRGGCQSTAWERRQGSSPRALTLAAACELLDLVVQGMHLLLLDLKHKPKPSMARCHLRCRPHISAVSSQEQGHRGSCFCNTNLPSCVLNAGELCHLYGAGMRMEAAFFSDQPGVPAHLPIGILAVDFDDTCTAADTIGLIINTAIAAAEQSAGGGHLLTLVDISFLPNCTVVLLPW